MDRRMITGRTPDPISLRGIEEAPRSAAPLAKSRFYSMSLSRAGFAA